MEELRELILAHLGELHGTGLSDERYQLYVDTVYQCDTVDKLIELAALELQLEANEFFLQLVEQMHVLEENSASVDDVAFHNSDGFGDEDGFGEEESEEEFFPEDGGFGDEPQHTGFSTPSNPNLIDGFGGQESDSDEIDPQLSAMQKALLGLDDIDMTDPSYFDIDALLTKAGSVTTEITLGEQPPKEYNDELANLLSAYSDEEGAGGELEFDALPEEPAQPAQRDSFGQPVSFGRPAQQGGFGQAPAGFGKPVGNAGGFNRPPQAKPTQGFGQPIQPTPQVQAQRPSRASVAMNNAKNVFAGFSKRKPSK